MFRRNKVAMLVAEFLGTGILTLVVLSVQRSQLNFFYFVALVAGLAVAAMTYVLGRTSGAQMNPALTLGLWTARRVKTLPAIVYIIVQLLGAWAAYGLYHYFVHTDIQAVTQDFSGRILVAEAIGTFIFSLGWAAAAYNRFEEGRFAAVAGTSFVLAMLVASSASGIGLANPALAVGSRAWEVFGQNGWGNYVLGPVLGAIIGVNLYGLLFADLERPLFGRRRVASAGVVTTSTLADADDGADEVVAEKPARTSSRSTSSRSTSRTAKAKKTSAKKTSSKRKR